jgi:hypothetical protein
MSDDEKVAYVQPGFSADRYAINHSQLVPTPLPPLPDRRFGPL